MVPRGNSSYTLRTHCAADYNAFVPFLPCLEPTVLSTWLSADPVCNGMLLAVVTSITADKVESGFGSATSKASCPIIR